jgi:parvulin-like peptidyl-prolyl isomerase
MMVVSKVTVEPAEIVSFLKANCEFKQVCEKILYQKIIEQAAQVRGLIVTPEEIEQECDRLRREKKLEKASDTLAWLSEQMIGVEDLEKGISDRILADKLANTLFAKEIDKVFGENRINFEQVLLYQIVLPYDRLAQELFYQIEEEEISFYEAAHLYDIDEKRREVCGFEGKLYRWNLPPDLASVIFSLAPGEIARPLKTEQGYHLLMAEEFFLAELTPEVSQKILEQMFNQWLTSELNYFIHNQT